MADTNPFAGVRRLLSPTYWLELPEISWRPVFAIELEHDSQTHSNFTELRNERYLISIASAMTAPGAPDGAGTRDIRSMSPDELRALLQVQQNSYELDREKYPTTVVKGWRNAQAPDGTPIPFSPEMCAMLFDPKSGLTDIVFEKIRAAAKDPANFPGLAAPPVAQVEAAAGNS